MRYTLDGTNAKEGTVYAQPFPVPAKGCTILIAAKAGEVDKSAKIQIPADGDDRVVIGADTIDFIGKNAKKFGKWAKAAGALLKARSALKDVAPIIYDKLFNHVLKLTGKNLYEVANGARFVGALIGTVGIRVMTRNFRWLAVLWAIFLNAFTKTVFAVAGAAKIGLKNNVETAEALINHFKDAGVTISPKETDSLAKEVSKNSRVLVGIFTELNEAFEGLEAD